MIEQRQDEFAELSASAEEALERSGASLPHHKLLLRLWYYPSFERHISWFVYSPLQRHQESDSPIVCELVWDRPFDAQRFSDPLKGIRHGFSVKPTLSFRQAELPPDELELKLAALKSIVLPVFVDDGSFGLDGDHSGIETFGFISAVRLTWWSNRPGEWKALIDWAEDMTRFLDACLETQPFTSHTVNR